MRMSYQELYRRRLIDRVVRGIMYLLTGFAAVFLAHGGAVGFVLAAGLIWVVFKYGVD